MNHLISDSGKPSWLRSMLEGLIEEIVPNSKTMRLHFNSSLIIHHITNGSLSLLPWRLYTLVTLNIYRLTCYTVIVTKNSLRYPDICLTRKATNQIICNIEMSNLSLYTSYIPLRPYILYSSDPTSYIPLRPYIHYILYSWPYIHYILYSWPYIHYILYSSQTLHPIFLSDPTSYIPLRPYTLHPIFLSDTTSYIPLRPYTHPIFFSDPTSYIPLRPYILYSSQTLHTLHPIFLSDPTYTTSYIPQTLHPIFLSDPTSYIPLRPYILYYS